MSIRYGRGLTAALLAAALLSGANAWADSACDCWYSGFEDALEYTWGTRFQSEHYEGCKNTGGVEAYERGFQASESKEARRCPYSGG